MVEFFVSLLITLAGAMPALAAEPVNGFIPGGGKVVRDRSVALYLERAGGSMRLVTGTVATLPDGTRDYLIPGSFTPGEVRQITWAIGGGCKAYAERAEAGLAVLVPPGCKK